MKKTLKSRPNWRDAYRALRHEMDNGILKPGDDLPTLTNLAAKSGLSVHGSRRVLERLCKEGRAHSWQGTGFRAVAGGEARAPAAAGATRHRGSG